MLKNSQLIKKITKAVNKFELNLKGITVLTEAATGNYVVTPIIAALAGAEVYAFTKDSKYGKIEDVINQTNTLSQELNLSHQIKILTALEKTVLQKIDILTNTGFLRPITKETIYSLPGSCVIPLMWEPWEFRTADLDLEACLERGIKVYGTNESDQRLRTLEYIGFAALYFLLEQKLSPFSANILLIGCIKFVEPVNSLLIQIGYRVSCVTTYKYKINVDDFDAIILLEHDNQQLLIGNEEAFINKRDLSENQLVVHFCGNVDFGDSKFNKIPEIPAEFGYMSFTTDFIDNMAVVDLHTAGLKVGEGMIQAGLKKLANHTYKAFMEKNYPALAFENKKYW